MNSALHILLLEDSPTDAEMVERLLKKEFAHLTISHAADKRQYRELLESTKPDVILADNSLPQFNATEALLMLHHRSLRIPFILVTGTVSEEFAAGIIKLGAHDYVLKDRLARLPSAIDAAIKQVRSENERMEAYSRLIQSEERYRMLIERISDAFIALDSKMCYTYVNRQAGILIRRDPKTLIGKCIWTEFPDVVNTPTYHAFMDAYEQQRYITNTDYYAPLDLWHENFIYPSPDGLSVFIRDITERKRSENQLLRVNEELHELSAHLQNIREEERKHIAREIHDELGQQLTGLKMDMRWLQKKLENNEPEIIEKIAGAVQLIDETVASVRRIASDLRPSILDDLGLTDALEWHSRQVAKRSEIEVNFESSVSDLRLSPETATGLFRIYQEVITNAVRHANAQQINTKLYLENDRLIMFISDNGKGIETGQPLSGKTFGLLGIKERSNILGGSVNIQSDPGKGTAVTISIPYQKNKDYNHVKDSDSR
jgi:two-component system sensor histidine kinase UhpB